jgi:hypothetical protein
MAAAGYEVIQIYGSLTAGHVPVAANLTTSSSGVELALNAADGKLYFKNALGVVTLLASTETTSGSFAASSVAITGGTINGTTIGATNPTTGAFTSLTASSFTSPSISTSSISLGGSTLTSTTGTGSIVLSNGATLTAPNLGTPTSVVLTNATGLPLTTGVTGVLPVSNGGTGVSTITGLVKGNGSSPFTVAVAGIDYLDPASKGVANGVATLDLTGHVPLTQLPASLAGTLVYKGVWNAATNTPTLTSGTGVLGQYYVVNVAGSTVLDGNTGWLSGDMAVFNGITWDKLQVALATSVISVNGYTGAVTLTASDVGAANSGANTNITSLSGLTTALSVSQGGTGTTTATGTGSTVRSNSPSLVSPNLGTPTSAILTNATGLPLTTGVTGTLPIANGGTGATTATAALNALAGGVTAGTFLRGNGVNIVLGAIQAVDVPTLNQNTTGTASLVTSPTQSAITSLGTLTALNVSGTTALTGGTAGLLLNGSAGTAGQVLTSAGAGFTPVWSSAAGGGVSTFNTRAGAVTLTSADVISALGYTPGSSTGSVTSVAVTTANGFVGTVTNPNTTAAIQLSTSVSGIVKGSSGALMAATAGTDYAAPTTGSAAQLLANNGSGGFSNVTLGTGLTLSSGTLTATATGSGSVTSVSVVSANGFAGSVATPTTTPAVTLTTSVSGMLKGSSGALASAVAGTDYAVPTTGAALLAGNSSGGFTNVTVGTGLSYSGGVLSSTGGATATYTRTTYTATAGQTTFLASYTVGYVQVYVNGVLLPAADYTASSGTSVILATSANLNDVVELVAYAVTSIASTSAANIVGGAANQIHYQSAANSTAFITAPVTANTFLKWGGSSFSWATASGLSGYYSVVDYGATGNGSTDDTAAIQAADTAATEAGGTVWFPPGTYKINASGVTGGGASWKGASKKASKLVAAAVTWTFGNGMLTLNTKSDVTISDLTFDFGNPTFSSSLNYPCIAITSGTRIVVRDCEILNLRTYCSGVMLSGTSSYCTIENNYINLPSPSANYSQAIASSGATTMHNSILNNVCVGSAMYFEGQYYTVKGNHIRNWQFGGGITCAVPPAGAENFVITDNVIAYSSGIDVNSTYPSGIEFWGNGSVISNNNISYMSGSGISFSGSNNTLCGNVIRNSGQGLANGAVAGIGAIAISSMNFTECVVMNNRCYDDQATKTQNYGYYEYVSGGTISQILVSNSINNFHGNKTANSFIVSSYTP